MERTDQRDGEAGFSMVEMVIAMTILNIALLGIVGLFGSSMLTLKRAGAATTAATLADQQLEIYRTLPFDAIGLDTAQTGDSTYQADNPSTNIAPTGYSCATGGDVRTNFPSACTPARTVNAGSTPASPDRKNYRVDTYVNLTAASGSDGATKLVTIVVRDGLNLTGTALARSVTRFACSTGKEPANTVCP